MSESVLYVIGVKRGGCIVGPVKVGITNSIGARLASLQTGNPAPLAVYIAAPLGSREMVACLEEVFHHVMAHKRLVGEWFDMAPAEAMQAFFGDCRRFLTDGPQHRLARLEAKYGIPAK